MKLQCGHRSRFPLAALSVTIAYYRDGQREFIQDAYLRTFYTPPDRNRSSTVSRDILERLSVWYARGPLIGPRPRAPECMLPFGTVHSYSAPPYTDWSMGYAHRSSILKSGQLPSGSACRFPLEFPLDSIFTLKHSWHCF